MSKMGVEPLKLSPDEFARFIRAEIDDAAGIVKSAGIKAE
jgi:tripartite-type tricarboxylate transporter receptor subunit TctC